MFDYRKKLGLLALASAATALSGCGGDGGGSQEPLATCNDGLILDESTNQCVERPFVCPAGSVLPEDFVGDNPTNADCGPPPFDGPDPIVFAETISGGDFAVVFYNRQRSDQEYDGWTLYQWNDASCDLWPDDTPSLGAWPGTAEINGADFAPAAYQPDGVDPVYGAFWVVPTRPQSEIDSRLAADPEDNIRCGNFIINDMGAGEQTNNGRVLADKADDFNKMAFVVVPDSGVLGNNAVLPSVNPVCADEECTSSPTPVRSVADIAAHWVDVNTIVIGGADSETTEVALWGSTTGGLTSDENGNIVAGEGGDASMLATLSSTDLTEEQRARVPHLSGDGYAAFTVDGMTVDVAKAAVTGQLLAVATDGEGSKFGTAVQTSRLLDALYTWGENDADEATFGLTYADNSINVSVWAPTAQQMRIKLYSSAQGPSALRVLNSIEDMTLDTATGIWSYEGSSALDGSYYRYEATQFDVISGTVRVVESTDPYSVSVATDGLYTQFIDINSDALKPAGWDDHEVPAGVAPEEMVVYEGHIRDFTAYDESTSVANRGKYLGFTETGTAPVGHLQALADAGLTHFQILPMYDSGTVVEAPAFKVNLENTVEELCDANSGARICDEDHPAYQSDSTLTLQQVYESFEPSTNDALELASDMSVVDSFNWGYMPHHFNVPEGHYSSDPEGTSRILEMRQMIMALHGMGLRVVMDQVYNHTDSTGLDAFTSTFDKLVPGYYYRRNPTSGVVEGGNCINCTASENRMMAKFMEDSTVQWAQHYAIDGFRYDLMGFHPRQVMLDVLAAVRTVDEDTNMWGEGWNPDGGSSALGDAIFVTATQDNMGDTDIGTFNDHSRDSLRTGGLFGGNADAIRIGLAGNLVDYSFYSSTGQLVSGSDANAYSTDPSNNIFYVTSHDDGNLFDFMQINLPAELPTSDRIRAQNMTSSAVLLGQGISFIHMGSDILRSKSLDRNTYDSGDWFNRVDFTYQDNNWNKGLPANTIDGTDNAVVSANELSVVGEAEITFAHAVFKEFLEISKSSPLFSLQTSEDIISRLGFHNMGVAQRDGVIVMSLNDGSIDASLFTNLTEDQVPEDIDPNYDAIVVFFNGSNRSQTLPVTSATGFELISAQANGVDAATHEGTSFSAGSFTVPAFTTAIFVKPQDGAQGTGLYAGASPAPGGDVPNPFGQGERLYIRGSMNGWGTGNEAVYDLAGNFTAYADLAEDTTFAFKVANIDYNPEFIVKEGDITLGDDIEFTLGTAGAPNPSVTIPAGQGGEYRFIFNALNPDAPTLNIAPAETYAAAPLYIRGFLGDWDGLTREFTYEGESTYTLEVTIEESDMPSEGLLTTAFKVADETYGGDPLNTGFNFGVANGSDPYAAGREGSGSIELNNNANTPAGQTATNQNISITFSKAGDYLFKIDARNPLYPVLSVVPVDPFEGTPLYIRGVNGDWGAPSAHELMFQGDAVYSAQITIDESATSQFKVADQDWGDGDDGAGRPSTDFNWGVGGPQVFHEQTHQTVRGSNNVLNFVTTGTEDGNDTDEDGDYIFTFDVSDGDLNVTVVPVPE